MTLAKKCKAAFVIKWTPKQVFLISGLLQTNNFIMTNNHLKQPHYNDYHTVTDKPYMWSAKSRHLVMHHFIHMLRQKYASVATIPLSVCVD